MLFRKWAESWGTTLSQTARVEDSYKKELIRYVMEMLLSGVLSLALIFSLATACGVLKTALLITLVLAVLKNFTGGLHMSTPLRCAVAGAMVMVGLSFLALHYPFLKYSLSMKVLFLAFINVIVWRRAPLEAKGKPLTERQKQKLACLSRVLVFVVSIICLFFAEVSGINELFYALFFQGINLLEVTGVGVGRLDCLMGYMEKKPVF